MISPLQAAPTGGGDFGPRRWLPLAATLFGAALVFRLVFYTGLIGSDDLWYAMLARQVADGTYTLEPHHFAIRYGLLVPVAVVFRFLGLHEWTMTVLPLIASSLAVVLTALIAFRLGGPTTAWVAGWLMATLPADVHYASTLVPEPIQQAFLLAGVWSFLHAADRRSDLHGGLAGVFFGLAYLTKETGAFVAIAFFVFAVVRRQWRLAFTLAAGSAAVVIGETIWYWSQSGNPLFRFGALGVHNLSEGATSSNASLSWRIWKEYPRMMLLPNLDFGIHSLAVLLLATLAVLRGWLKGGAWFLVLWAVVPFAYLNFGSTRLDRYWVIPAAPRYILMIYPALVIMGALAVAGLARTRRRYFAVASVVASVCVVGLGCSAAYRNTGYRTADMHQLKLLAQEARRGGYRMCEVAGATKVEWQLGLQIIAPDLIGCDATARQLVPDDSGLPRLTTAASENRLASPQEPFLPRVDSTGVTNQRTVPPD